MRTTVKRIATGAVAAVVGTLTALVVVTAPAEAYCIDGSSRSIIYYNSDRQIHAKERSVSGTCDGDDIYNGQIIDPLEDGYAVRVRYRDAGVASILAYAYSNSWVNFRFYDQNGDSHAGFQVWSTPDSNPGTYYYGTSGY